MELPIPKSKKNISYPLKVRVEFAKTAKGLRTKWHEEKQSKKNRRWCQKQKKYVQKNPDWGFIKSTVELHFPGADKMEAEVSNLIFPYSIIVNNNNNKNIKIKIT